jgi:hypothetical protein
VQLSGICVRYFLSLYSRSVSHTLLICPREHTIKSEVIHILLLLCLSPRCLPQIERDVRDYIHMIISLMSIVMSLLVFLIAVIQPLDGKFLPSSGSSSIIVLRHIRLATDDEFYRVRCPYNLNHLTVTLLNYSTENCFNLYTGSMHNACATHRSPCRFHAKPLPMMCNVRLYSNQVDITYQCSLSSSNETE